MPWKECDIMSLRRELVELAQVEGANVAALCRGFGVSRKTAYKWLGRYQGEGVAGLADRSRRPKRQPRLTPEPVWRRVLAVRAAHPTWGGRKIRWKLGRSGCEHIPSASTITAILHRHGRISECESRKRGAWQRFERPQPNDLWQMDYKGEFKTADGRWCYPLTVLDDHSRYSLALRACVDQRGRTVKQALLQVFRQYGLPWAMLMDHGTPWAISHTPGCWTRLTVWLLRLDVEVCHGRPYHPQTQGKEERFHRTLQAELLQGRAFADRVAVQGAFDPWRGYYNHDRPHEALGMQPPASRYRVSEREHPEVLPPIEYGVQDAVRKVNPVGQLRYCNRVFKMSEAFGGEPVGLRPTREDGVLDVYYCWQRIGQIDLRQCAPNRSGHVRAAASGRCAPSSRSPDA